MEYANPTFLFIIYKITKGKDNKKNFKQIEKFDQLFENNHISNIFTAQILLNIIKHHNLDIKLFFDESSFFDDEGIRRGVEWSRLDEIIDQTIFHSFDADDQFYNEDEDKVINIRDYYKKYFYEQIKIARESINLDWFSLFVEKVRGTNNKDVKFLCESILSCVKFDLYQKNNIKKIEKRFLKYLENFKKDGLELTKLANFYNYRNNKKWITEIIEINYKQFGKNFFIEQLVLPQDDIRLRFLETLFVFEYIDNYISINKIELKKNKVYCLLNIRNKFIKKLKEEGSSLDEILVQNKKEKNNKKTTIYIDKIYGIYKNEKTKNPCYPLKNNTKRFKMIKILNSYESLSPKSLMGKIDQGYSALNKSIKEVNDNFKTSINLKKDLIIQSSTSAYLLNKDKYNIIFI